MFKNKKEEQSIVFLDEAKEKNRLIEEIAHLGKKHSEVVQAIEEMEAKQATMKKNAHKPAELEKVITDLEEQKKKLKTAVEEEERRLSVLRENSVSTQKVLEKEYDEKVTIMRRVITELKEKEQQKEQSLEKTESRLESTLRQLKEAKGSLSVIKTEVSDLEPLNKDVNDLRKTKAELEVDITNLNGKYNQYVKKVASKEKEVDDLNIRIETADHTHRKILNEIEKAQKDKQTLLDATKKEVDEARKELDDKLGLISDKENWLKSKEDKLKEIKAEVEKIHGKKISVNF